MKTIGDVLAAIIMAGVGLVALTYMRTGTLPDVGYWLAVVRALGGFTPTADWRLPATAILAGAMFVPSVRTYVWSSLTGGLRDTARRWNVEIVR